MAQPEPFCPYAGLQPYTEAEREFFFGREEDQETIAANLVTTPLTILYGTSGVGKTSVLLAGVVPFLRKLPNVIVVVFRDWQDRTFLASLKDQIARAVVKQAGQLFSVDDASLDQLLSRVASVSHSTLTIVFDQFEEYFLYHPESETENQFDAEFARAVNRDDVDANFLLSIREDSLSLLDRFQRRIPNVLGNYLRLEHLDRPAGIRAIRKPLERYNERRAVPGEHGIDIEDALVDILVEQVKTERVAIGQARQGVVHAGEGAEIPPGLEPIRIETPFLQMVLTRLWDEEIATGSRLLRQSTLEHLGGAKQIVRTYLDDEMSKFTDDDRGIAARLFRFLVTPSGTKIAYASSDLISMIEDPAEQVTRVLTALAQARILRPLAPPLDQPGILRYEIFHDVLAPAILNWRRATERAAAEKRAAMEAAKQAEEAARQQEEQRHAEAARERAEQQMRSTRRLWRLTAVLACVLLLALAAAALAWQQWGLAKKSEQTAIDASFAAQSALATAVAERSRADQASAALSEVLNLGHLTFVSDRPDDVGSLTDYLRTKGATISVVRSQDIGNIALSKPDIIIIGADTATAWTRMSKTMLAQLFENYKLIGMGEGGGKLFEQLGLEVGSDHGWMGSMSRVRVETPELLQSPFSISAPDRLVEAYVQSSGIAIYDEGSPTVAGFEGIGRQEGDRNHWLIARQGNYVFWGFGASTQRMTEDGKRLFANLVSDHKKSPNVPLSQARKKTTYVQVQPGMITERLDALFSRHKWSFQVVGPGHIHADLTWQPADRGLALILNGPGRVGYYERQDGRSPLSLDFEVTNEHLKLGTDWTVSVTCFEELGSDVVDYKLNLSFPYSKAGP